MAVVEEKDWRFMFFFCPPCCGLLVVVVLVVVGAVGLFGIGIYYFIIVVYNILL